MLLEKLKKYKVVLASASPRRKQLLEEMGLAFRVASMDVDESLPKNLTPEQSAEYLSKIKANAFPESEFYHDTLIITADTIVTIDNDILGKPSDRDEAVQALEKLSGKSHMVITGVTIRLKSKLSTFSVSTEVHFSQLEKSEINYYVDHYEPYDKAGAYGIQEWIGHVAIEGINGSYFNVMGLPTHRLYEELLKIV